jgi:biopolymer transport protein ExbB/TolQ
MAEWLAAQGGLVGLGVHFSKYVLLVFSVISVAVMVERTFSLRRTRRIEEADYRALREAMPHRRMDAASATDAVNAMEGVSARAAASVAPCAVALHAGLSHHGAPPERVREAIAQELEVQTVLLSRNLPVLATIASTAPYVGLFGTVLGILMAFRQIAATGRTGAAVVAGGISEALTATAIGLGVAIPAVIAYNYFTDKVNDLSLKVETHAFDLAMRLPDAKAAMATESRSGGEAGAGR